MVFESDYYYVLWWHSNDLHHCSKDQVIRIINEMRHPDDLNIMSMTLLFLEKICYLLE